MNQLEKVKIRKSYVGVISLLFFYTLYAPTKIKQILSLMVADSLTTNLIWMIMLSCIILMFNYKKYSKKNTNLIILIMILLFSLNVLNSYKMIEFDQYLYAMLLYFLPMTLFFFTRQCNEEELAFLLKFFIVNTLLYSILAILFSTNFAFFMKLAGNDYLQYQNYTQMRAPMMFGTSIAVSYYLNLSLPFCFFVYSTASKKWKRVAMVTIAFNILATVILLSRLATLIAVFIAFSYIFLEKKNLKHLYKFIIIFIIFVFFMITTDKIDLSRLNFLNGTTDANSNKLRYLSAVLAMYIWSKNIFIGSSMGKIFKREYVDPIVVLDGHMGLIDPHNTYVLILSEQGIIGLLLFIVLCLSYLHICIKQNTRFAIKASCLFLVGFLLAAMGGSHLFNSLPFGIVFWIYAGFYSRLDSIKIL